MAGDMQFVWLMERELDGVPAYWDGGHAESFTRDPWKAVWWVRREDLLNCTSFTKHYAQWRWRPVEHGFAVNGLREAATQVAALTATLAHLTQELKVATEAMDEQAHRHAFWKDEAKKETVRREQAEATLARVTQERDEWQRRAVISERFRMEDGYDHGQDQILAAETRKRLEATLARVKAKRSKWHERGAALTTWEIAADELDAALVDPPVSSSTEQTTKNDE